MSHTPMCVVPKRGRVAINYNICSLFNKLLLEEENKVIL